MKKWERHRLSRRVHQRSKPQQQLDRMTQDTTKVEVMLDQRSRQGQSPEECPGRDLGGNRLRKSSRSEHSLVDGSCLKLG